MNRLFTYSGPLAALTSLILVSACASDLGEPEGDGDSGTGGDAAGTGGVPGTGGTGTGGISGTGGAEGTTGGANGSGGAPEVVYSAGFQALRDVLTGYKIGRPDYSCASSDCHSGGHDHSDVPLRLVQDEGLYAELTTHISVKCGNVKAVEPGDPANSAIIKVLTVGCDENITPPDAAIPRMPYGCTENEFENTCVADEYIATIEQWILDGAPEF
jgi:hypothetical protein